MATFRYLSRIIPDPADPSSLYPVFLLDFPDLPGATVQLSGSNPSIPAGYAVVTVTGIDGNMDRAILESDYTSKFV